MGNAGRRRRLREGLVRPGPAERAASAVICEGQRLLLAESARERVRRHRQRMRDAKAESIQLSNEIVDEDVDNMSKRDLSRVSRTVAECIVEELKHCPGPNSRRAVMEKILRHDLVNPLLPLYYPRPEEALAIHQFIQGFQKELQLVKGAQSSHKLLRKGALLDAAVSAGVTNVSALSRVLNTKISNISYAVERKPEASTGLGPLKGCKRDDGLSEYTKKTVQTWWHDRTRVSLEKKHVCFLRKLGMPTVEHPTHFLTETQVSNLHRSMFFPFTKKSRT